MAFWDETVTALNRKHNMNIDLGVGICRNSTNMAPLQGWGTYGK